MTRALRGACPACHGAVITGGTYREQAGAAAKAAPLATELRGAWSVMAGATTASFGVNSADRTNSQLLTRVQDCPSCILNYEENRFLEPQSQ